MGKNNPGSPAAIKRGCSCPSVDNNRGKGVATLDGDVLFWMDEECPLHGNDNNNNEDDDELDRYLLPRA